MRPPRAKVKDVFSAPQHTNLTTSHQQKASKDPEAAELTGSVPSHVAVIMDGNGRWARARGLPRSKGHEAGAEAVRAVLRAAREHGVRYLTLYAFSVENWSRPRHEVAALMRLLGRFLKQHEADLHENRTRLRILGRRADLPQAVDAALRRTEASTADYQERQLIVALSYGGRTEIAEAARRMAEDTLQGRLRPDEIDERRLADYLYLPDVPDPDLIVRTSGELRLSNFLIWQAAYSEFYVTPVLWPDFREPDFAAALEAYRRRQRRFGGVPDGPGGSAQRGESAC